MEASLETLRRQWRAAAERAIDARKAVAKAKSALYLAELQCSNRESEECMARFALGRAREAADE
jgi:hypothetical protein